MVNGCFDAQGADMKNEEKQPGNKPDEEDREVSGDRQEHPGRPAEGDESDYEDEEESGSDAESTASGL